MLRSLAFSARSLRYFGKNNSLGASFSNRSCINTLSTSKVVPKDDRHKDWMPYTNCTKKFSSKICHQEVTEAKVKLTFKLHDGKHLETEAKVGDTLLDVVVNNDLNIEGFGACEGTLTCSTCHVILKQEDYDRLPEEASDEERDMLDLAYSLTDTSRLGCQITLTKDMEGLEVQVPETINDARS